MKIRMCPSIATSLKSIAQRYLLDDAAQEVVAVYSFSYFYNIHAQGLRVEGGFLVFKGSLAAIYENRKLSAHHKKLRKILIENGTLQQKDGFLEFVRPYLFKNEYEASSVIAGNNKCRSQIGVWTDANGRAPLENQLIGISELEMKDI